jgi:hypothetical protein
LHRGVACIDGTTWHGYSSPYRTSNGSHTRLTLQSRIMWRWLLQASATFAAEQPSIRAFPTVLPLDRYPPSTLRLPAQVDAASSPASAVVATAQEQVLRTPALSVQIDDTRIVAQGFALLWSPLLGQCPVLQQLLQCRSFCLSSASSSVPLSLSKYCFDVYLPSTDVVQRPSAWRFDPSTWKQDGGTLLEALPKAEERALFAGHCNPWLPLQYQCVCDDPERVFVRVARPSRSSSASHA